MSSLAKDLVPEINGPGQLILGMHAWTSSKVQKKGLNNYMFKVWRHFARCRGYRLYYGVAVNPISMHMEKKHA